MNISQCLLLACALFTLLGQGTRTRARAQAALELGVHAGLGAGSHQSSLPSALGDKRVAPSAFPAVGFELRVATAPSPSLRVGGVFQYASSFGYALSRPIFSDARESSAARAQDLALNALAEFRLGARADAWAIPVMLGYGLCAFTTDQPLAAASSYLLTGPRLSAGVQIPLFDARIVLRALPEVGAVLSASAPLRRQGVAHTGLEYGWLAELGVRLPLNLQLGVRYRESHVGLSVQGHGTFRQVERFVLGSVSWQGGG